MLSLRHSAVLIGSLLGAWGVAGAQCTDCPVEIDPPFTPAPPRSYDAYVALIGTPLGGLAPLATSTIAGVAQGSPRFSLRYGYLGNEVAPLGSSTTARSASQIAATLSLPVTLGATVSVTGGIVNRSAGGGTDPTGSLAADWRLLEQPFGAPDGTLRLTAGVSGEVGAGRVTYATGPGTVVAGMVGIPIGLVIGQADQGTRFVPFLTPAFALTSTPRSRGASSYSVADDGRFVFGGGVGVMSPVRNLSGSLGFQHVAVGRSDTLVGITLSIGGR